MSHYGTHHSAISGISLAISVVGTVFAASACSATGDGGPAETSASASPTAEASATLLPEQIEDPQEAAIAAYARYWNTITAELEAPDGNFTALEVVASGQALEYAMSIEQRGVDEQLHGTGEFSHDIEVKDSVITNDAAQVVVTDCSDSSDTQVLDANNTPVAGEEYGPSRIEARVELIDGRWLVTVIAVQEIGSCTPDDS